MKKAAIIILTLLLIYSCDIFNNEEDNSESIDKTLDSDGDGYSDYDEINTFLHSNSINPLKFNPLIADLPDVSFELRSLPKITILLEHSEESSREVTTEWSNSTENSKLTSKTSGTATSVTNTYGITVGVEHEFGIGGGTTASLETSYEYSQSKEVSSSNTVEMNSTKAQTYNEARTLKESAGYSYSEGEIMVFLDITNSGNISYTLNDLVLTAYTFSPLNSKPIVPIAELTYDGGFSSKTLNVGESISAIFSAKIPGSEAMDLLLSPGSIKIKVASYDIVDENDRSFKHNGTEIGAKTFSLMIDYGVDKGLNTEKYQISDVSIHDSLDKIFTNILGINDYTESEQVINGLKTKGLTKVRNLEANSSTGGWIVVHTYSDSGIFKNRIYSPKESYSLSDIKPVRGDKLLIIYVEDKDHDGLLAREEFSYGTSDLKEDTDNDGKSDLDEIEAGTNPLGKDLVFTPKVNIEEDITLEYGIGEDTMQPYIKWSADFSGNYSLLILRDTDLGEGGEISFEPEMNGKYDTGHIASIGVDVIGIKNLSDREFTDNDVNYNSLYFYKVFLRDNSTGRFNKGQSFSIRTHRKIQFSVNKFEVLSPSDNGKAEFRWYLSIRDSQKNDISIINDRRSNDWSIDSDTNFLISPFLYFGKYEVIRPYNEYEDNSNIFYAHVNVQEDDGDAFDHGDNEIIVKEDRAITGYAIRNAIDFIIDWNQAESNGNNRVQFQYWVKFPKDKIE